MPSCLDLLDTATEASPEQAKIITGLENDGVAHVALISRNNEMCIRDRLLGNYATWKQGGGIPGDGTSPLAASPDFLLCLSSELRPPYGRCV